MNEVTWFVIPTTDVARARAFWGGLFNWKIEGDDASGFLNVTPPSGPDAGIMKMKEIKVKAPEVFVLVADARTAAEKAVALGGSVTSPARDEGDHVWAIVADADGVQVGLWQNK